MFKCSKREKKNRTKTFSTHLWLLTLELCHSIEHFKNSRVKCLNEFNRLINPLVNYNKYVVQDKPYQTLFNVS